MTIDYKELENLAIDFRKASEEEVYAIAKRILAYKDLTEKVRETVCDITGRKLEEMGEGYVDTSSNGVIMYRFLDKKKKSMERVEIDTKSKKIYYF